MVEVDPKFASDYNDRATDQWQQDVFGQVNA